MIEKAYCNIKKNRSRTMKDLTKGKILPLLLGFAVPIAIGNIFQLFYSLAYVLY